MYWTISIFYTCKCLLCGVLLSCATNVSREKQEIRPNETRDRKLNRVDEEKKKWEMCNATDVKKSTSTAEYSPVIHGEFFQKLRYEKYSRGTSDSSDRTLATPIVHLPNFPILRDVHGVYLVPDVPYEAKPPLCVL